MESKNARFLKQGMIDRCKAMTPAQRVKSFIEHSRQMKLLRQAGEARRKKSAQKKASHG
jgi:hypothetical protein